MGRSRWAVCCVRLGESVSNTLTGMLLAASAGLNAFLPILILALADRFSSQVDLPQPYNVISSIAGIVILMILVTVDLVADKIPRIDHLNDLVNSPIRPAAGIFLMMAAVSGKGEIHEVVALFIGLLLAGVVHAYKAMRRTRITVATNGLANPMVSMVEDGIAGLTSVLAILFPWLGLAFVIPAGVGLGWIYRKTGGSADSANSAKSEQPGVIQEEPVQRKPKRTVDRRPRSGSTTTIQPDSRDA